MLVVLLTKPLVYVIHSSHVSDENLNCKSASSMWASEVEYIDLEKGEKGLGFSILDYQVM